MNKVNLLNQLHIDREAPQQRGPGRGLPWLLILGGVLGLVVVAVAVWLLIAQPWVMSVKTAQAQPLGGSAGSAGASLLDASGYVVARRQATVSSKITGKVVEALIEEGQKVEAGQVIARLDDSNWRAQADQARAQLAAAQANLHVAQVTADEAGPKYRRLQDLHARGFLSDQAVEDARAANDTAGANVEWIRRQATTARAALMVAQRNLDDTVVRAPFAGVVTVKAAQPGEMVSPISAGGGYTRTGIGTIVDMDSLEVEVDVAESFINRVQAGMPAMVKLNAYPDWEIPAEVIAVIPTADRSKATVSVRIRMKVKDPRIVPEMGARVAFLGPAQPASAVAGGRSVKVPSEAVATEGGGQPVAYVVENGHAVRRPVGLGAVEGSDQILTAGVSPGEQVIVGKLDKLHDGMKVRVKTEKSSGG